MIIIEGHDNSGYKVMPTVKGNSDCTLCDLHSTAQSVCLMGQGPVPCDYMIIGEAPGKREDDINEPFVGRAGILLENLLEEAGFSREMFFITNSAKCRPPNNNTPTPKQLKACKPYLLTEIDKVKPKWIFLLGAVAIKQCLGGKAKVTELHGQCIEKDGYNFLLTFHPAAALRYPEHETTIIRDFKSFHKLINGKSGSEYTPNYTIINSMKVFYEAMDWTKKQKWISNDIETSGLNPVIEGSFMNSYGFGNHKKQWLLPLSISKSPWSKKRQQELLEHMKERFSRKRMIWQNGKFDNKWLTYIYDIRMRHDFDTQYSSHLINENESTALKYKSRIEFGSEDYDIPLEEKTNPTDLNMHYEYLAKDVMYTHLLFLKNHKEMRIQEVEQVHNHICIPASEVYERMELNGVYIRKEKFKIAQKQINSECNKLERQLEDISGWQCNWGSPQQVSQILFDEMGIISVGNTPKGIPSTSEDNLKAMVTQHKIIDVLLKYREQTKLRDGFIGGWEKRMLGNYLYPSVKITGTVTGRPSYSDPNLQQTPKNNLIRNLVGAPKGWSVLHADYSQIELRIAALMACEETMLEVFQNEEDVHLKTALSIISGSTQDSITKEQRDYAKPVNFGFIYGMWWKNFKLYAFSKYGVIITDNQAKKYRQMFFDMYPGFIDWHEKQKRIVKINGQVRTYTGRIRHLPNINSPDRGTRQEAERQAINSPVQGFGAELTLMGTSAVHKEFYDNSWFKPFATIHDALLARIRNDKIESTVPVIKKIMENPPALKKLGIVLDVPIVVNIDVGEYWGL